MLLLIEINRLGEILTIINECSKRLTIALSNNSLSLKDFYDPFEKIQNEYANEFAVYNLDAAIIAIITPVVSIKYLMLQVFVFIMIINKFHVKFFHRLNKLCSIGTH